MGKLLMLDDHDLKLLASILAKHGGAGAGACHVHAAALHDAIFPEKPRICDRLTVALFDVAPVLRKCEEALAVGPGAHGQSLREVRELMKRAGFHV